MCTYAARKVSRRHLFYDLKIHRQKLKMSMHMAYFHESDVSDDWLNSYFKDKQKLDQIVSRDTSYTFFRTKIDDKVFLTKLVGYFCQNCVSRSFQSHMVQEINRSRCFHVIGYETSDPTKYLGLLCLLVHKRHERGHGVVEIELICRADEHKQMSSFRHKKPRVQNRTEKKIQNFRRR